MEHLFDDNIKQLCKEIRETVPLDFVKHEKQSYNSTIKKDDKTGSPESATVWYYEPLSLPKIAHELYHIKIGLILGDIEVMVAGCSNNFYTQHLLDYEFCSGFLNQIDHCIFYHLYKSQGYPDMDFFEGVDPVPFNAKLDTIEKVSIKQSNGKYVFEHVANYMRLMVLFMFFPIDGRFKNQVHRLKHIDSSLFNIFKDLQKVVTGMDIMPENREKLQNAYVSFRNAIDHWTSSRKFC